MFFHLLSHLLLFCLFPFFKSDILLTGLGAAKLPKTVFTRFYFHFLTVIN